VRQHPTPNGPYSRENRMSKDVLIVSQP